MLQMLLGAALMVTTSVLVAGAQEYAVGVQSFLPGIGDLGSVDLISNDPCRGNGRGLDLSDALGAPNDKFVSIGDGGTITLSFPNPIEDRPGADVRVWVSCNVSCEPGDVAASQDGINFVPLGSLATPFFEEYDLGSAGLPFATLIRVHDVPSGPCPGLGLAVDVDTVESLHPGSPVSVSRQSWAAVRTLYQ